MEDQRLILEQTPEQVRELISLHLERSKFWAVFAHAASTFARSQKTHGSRSQAHAKS